MIYLIGAYHPACPGWQEDSIVIAETPEQACKDVVRMGRMDTGVKAKVLPELRREPTRSEVYALGTE
jgi:hypothetical protein